MDGFTEFNIFNCDLCCSVVFSIRIPYESKNQKTKTIQYFVELRKNASGLLYLDYWIPDKSAFSLIEIPAPWPELANWRSVWSCIRKVQGPHVRRVPLPPHQTRNSSSASPPGTTGRFGMRCRLGTLVLSTTCTREVIELGTADRPTFQNREVLVVALLRNFELTADRISKWNPALSQQFLRRNLKLKMASETKFLCILG